MRKSFKRSAEEIMAATFGRLSAEGPTRTGLASQTLLKKKRDGEITVFGTPMQVCFPHLERELVAGHKLPFDPADYQKVAA